MKRTTGAHLRGGGASKLAFTLAEMMVVLLIITIVLAAMAPIVTTRMKHNVSSSGSINNNSPWVWAENNVDAYFGDGDDQMAMIGQTKRDNSDPKAKLIINTNDSIDNHVLFKKGSDVLGKLSINDNSLILGDYSVSGSGNTILGINSLQDRYKHKKGDNNIIIGINAGLNELLSSPERPKNSQDTPTSEERVMPDNSIAIGSYSVVKSYHSHPFHEDFARGAIAIGHYAEANESVTYIGSATPSVPAYYMNYASVAIGNKSSASNGGIAIGSQYIADRSSGGDVYLRTIASGFSSVAIGAGAVASDDYTVALGYNANASKQQAIAIGSNAEAVEKAIAIGYGAKAGQEASIAIGIGVSTDGPNQIKLGSPLDTVYIPGRLIVGHESFLGAQITGNHVGVAGAFGNGGVRGFLGDKSGSGFDVFGTLTSATGYNDTLSFIKGFNLSDRRLKYVGTENKSGLDKIRQMKIYNYTFKKDPSKEPRIGVMAQDLQKILPNAVKKATDGFLTIRPEDILYTLVNAVKELDIKVTEILKQVQDDRRQVQNDRKHLEQLQRENKELRLMLKQVQNDNKSLETRLQKLEAKLK